MSYGLYDGDLMLYPRVPFFNLELMKLSSFYKNRREIVNFSPDFNPQMYTNFIVRQDYPFYHPNYLNYDNVTYHGKAFDGEKYLPMDLSIEKMKPDRFLYNKIEDKAIVVAADKVNFNTMRRAEHLRLSLDGKTIWNSFESQLHKTTNSFGIIFHDYNLGEIESSYDLIKDLIPKVISNKAGRKIGMKYPVQIQTEENLLKWLQLSPMGKYYSLQYNGIITSNVLKDLSDINKTSSSIEQSVLNVTKNISYEEFITTGIIQLFELILDLRSYQVNFSLIYDRHFFIDSNWNKVMVLIDAFNNHIRYFLRKKDYIHRVAKYETFYDYIKRISEFNGHKRPRFKREDVINTFQFVRANNYELFVRFYEYVGERK